VNDLVTTWLVFGAAGSAAGLLAGLLGIGGGLVVVPILIYVFNGRGLPAEIALPLAFGTSTACILFTSASSARAHSARGTVLWRLFRWASPGIAVGAAAGAVCASVMPVASLRFGLAVYVAAIATKMLLGLEPPVRARPLGRRALALAGVLVGGISGMVGFGGATLLVPLLGWCGVTLKKAIGTSAALGFPIATAGTLGYILAGMPRDDLPPLALGFVYLPAVLGVVLPSMLMASVGARLTEGLPVVFLRRTFAIVLYTAAARLAL
jgi:uncharacterized membrane protein YfcA